MHASSVHCACGRRHVGCVCLFSILWSHNARMATPNPTFLAVAKRRDPPPLLPCMGREESSDTREGGGREGGNREDAESLIYDNPGTGSLEMQLPPRCCPRQSAVRSHPSPLVCFQSTAAGRATLAAIRGRSGILAFAPALRAQRSVGPALCLKMSGGATTSGPAKTPYVKTWLENEVTGALVRAFGEAVRNAAPMVTASTKPEFGDYQCNAAMSIAKTLKSKPRDVATKLCDELKATLGDAFEEPEIAGPGFLNLRSPYGPAHHLLSPPFPDRSPPAQIQDGICEREDLHDAGGHCASWNPKARKAVPRRRRLLFPQHRQGDARGAPEVHHHRRHPLPP